MSLFPKFDVLPEGIRARLSVEWNELSAGAKNEIVKLADLAVEYERLAIEESERRTPGFLK